MNYNKIMEETINNLKEGCPPSILLHSCCAPCSSHCIDTLTPYFNITILYYNPNIEPETEYNLRKQEEIRFINEYPNQNKLDFLDCDYENELYHETIKSLESEKEGGSRCMKCYLLRLEKTAKLAKEKGYDYFGTTLTISPLKNSQKINEFGEYLSQKYNIKYLYSDFKKKEGYKHSIELAKEYNLYRQDYCGCIYSKAEREQLKNIKNTTN